MGKFKKSPTFLPAFITGDLLQNLVDKLKNEFIQDFKINQKLSLDPIVNVLS